MLYPAPPQMDHRPALGPGVVDSVPRPSPLLSVLQRQQHVTIVHHPPVASSERRGRVRVLAQDHLLDSSQEKPVVAGLVVDGTVAFLADRHDVRRRRCRGRRGGIWWCVAGGRGSSGR
jgi:hypothetical protein